MSGVAFAEHHSPAAESHSAPVQTTELELEADPRIAALGAETDVGTLPEDLTVSEAVSQGGVTLPELEQLALDNNPAIKQASAVASMAAGIRKQVGLKPNPRIGYFADEIGDGGSAGLHGVFLSQTFVTGDKLAWNRCVIGHDVQSLVWQVEAQRYRVLTDLRQKFYEALAAQQRIELARKFRVVAEKGVAVADDRLKAGEGTSADVLQSEIQLAEVDLEIQQAEVDLRASWKRLVAIAGVPDLAHGELAGNFEIDSFEQDIEFAYRQLVSASPLLKAARSRVCRARANLRRQKLQAQPNLNAQLGVGYDDSTNDQFTKVQFSVPVSLHNKNQGNIRAAHAAYCEATQNVERLKLLVRTELARVMQRYQSAAATVSQYEEAILPKVRRTQELIGEAYAAGESDFLRVLTARKMFFDANLKYITALMNLATANAEIEGQLLSGGLTSVVTYHGGDDLRGQAFSQR